MGGGVRSAPFGMLMILKRRVRTAHGAHARPKPTSNIYNIMWWVVGYVVLESRTQEVRNTELWQLTLSGVHSIMMEKFSQAGEGGGVGTPTPFHYTVSTITYLWCTLQLRGQVLSPYFYSTPIRSLRLGTYISAALPKGQTWGLKLAHSWSKFLSW